MSPIRNGILVLLFFNLSSWAGDFTKCRKAGKKDPSPRAPFTINQGKNSVLLVRARCKSKSQVTYTTIACPCEIRGGRLVCEEDIQTCYEAFVRDEEGHHLHSDVEYTTDVGKSDGDQFQWTDTHRPYRVKIPDGSEINVGDALVTSPPTGIETVACNSASVSSAANCANDPSTTIGEDAERADLNSVEDIRSKPQKQSGKRKGKQGK